MRFPLIFLVSLRLIVPSVTHAADVNGYTAQYECKSGGANCNVDVATYIAHACDQTITTADSAGTIDTKINGGSQYICIQPGDYLSKGEIALSANGTSGARKVLTCRTSGGAACGTPWTSTSARVKNLYITGDYWVIYQIEVDSANASSVTGVQVTTDSQNVILGSILVEHIRAELVNMQGTDIVLQNSVIRTAYTPSNGDEYQCVSTGGGTNHWLVNNEIYDCNKGSHIHANGTAPGAVVENNDIYVSDAGRTNCSGTFTPTGNCGVMEAPISWKTGGTSGSPGRIIHNRIWNALDSDGTQVQVGDGVAISLSNEAGGTGAQYVLVQNNIILDSEWGIWNYYGGPDHNSIIGNLIYNIYDRRGIKGDPAWGIRYYGLSDAGVSGFDDSEIYLNTVIAAEAWLGTDARGTNNDIRCNVAISSGGRDGALGTGTQQDYNAYYGTTDSGETNKIKPPFGTRANSTSYSLNDVIRTTATPPADGTAGDFLYKVTTAGTSAGRAPSYCTTLGCTTTDGSAAMTAIRGPYIGKRKLRTVAGGETFVIPYARVHTSAPEAAACPASFANRDSIGIARSDNLSRPKGGLAP